MTASPTARRTIRRLVVITTFAVTASPLLSTTAASAQPYPVKEPRLPIAVANVTSVSARCPADLTQFLADLRQAGLGAQAANYVLHAVADDCS